MAIQVNKGEAASMDSEQTDLLQVVIGGREVLIRSSEVREVVRPLPLTRVPMGPDHILGLANIHGQIVSIIDVVKLSSLSAITSDASSSRARFLVLRHPVMHVAVWVDEVKRLRKVEVRLLKPAKNSPDTVYDIDIDGSTFAVLDTGKLFH